MALILKERSSKFVLNFSPVEIHQVTNGFTPVYCFLWFYFVTLEQVVTATCATTIFKNAN